ncbi:MAG: hypothetical protein IJD22_03750 [Clostridia bacterium]|nr:hypothetical protein [Clostridia bacterium]
MTVVVLTSSIIIRLLTGPTHIIYNVLGGRGIFPGPFAYTLFYFVRTTLGTWVLTFCIFSSSVYENRLRAISLSGASIIMLLLEYRLIFGGISLILAIAFAALAGSFSVASVVCSRTRSRSISVIMLAFAFLQMIHFLQLISLAVCI